MTARTDVETPQLDTAIATMTVGNMAALVAEFVKLTGEIGDALVPVATGALKRSRRPYFSDGGLIGGQTWGGGDVDYARFVHDGTVYMPARPWALMALVQAQKQFHARIALAMAGRG